MARVVFTSHLLRHVRCPESTVPGNTLAAVLHRLFDAQPQVRDYVLDEQAAHHGGDLVRRRLADEGPRRKLVARGERVSGTHVSKFGFAVAVHPRHADTAWFVPAIKDERRVPVDAALCVARTRDGGKSFEALREGLPQAQAYDLVYRHGLAVDATGERFAMGSTTGSLWLSEDQGDSWRCVSTHLPPIYCLRFG